MTTPTERKQLHALLDLALSRRLSVTLTVNSFSNSNKDVFDAAETLDGVTYQSTREDAAGPVDTYEKELAKGEVVIRHFHTDYPPLRA